MLGRGSEELEYKFPLVGATTKEWLGTRITLLEFAQVHCVPQKSL